MELFMLLVSIISFVYIYTLASASPGLEGGMDSYNHYIIARYAWIHPDELLLHQWGKPVYNIIASAFAQFGLLGVVVLNIIAHLGASWLAYFTARGLNFKHAFLAFFFALGSPIFFDNIISGLTEPLCALLLMVSVFLFVKDKAVLAAIVAGFLPYARSEGFVIIAVFGFYLIFISKNYKAFIALIAGSVIMNFIGWIVEGEALWIFTSNPYIKAQTEQLNLCGHGSILHYVRTLKYTMGIIPVVFFTTGTLLVLYHYFRSIKDKTTQKLFFLVLGVYGLYFIIHSVIWYLGMMGSCGYERVLVVIAPLAAIIMAFSAQILLNWISSIGPHALRKSTWYFIIPALYLLYIPIKTYGHKYPIDISDEQKEFVRVAEWYEKQNFQERRHYFLYPYLNILLNIDPKDTDRFIQLWSFDFDYAPKGSIVIWDGHFGPNESQLPLLDLISHPDFTLLKSFCPDPPFKTSNDYLFEIYVFERTDTTMLKK